MRSTNTTDDFQKDLWHRRQRPFACALALSSLLAGCSADYSIGKIQGKGGSTPEQPLTPVTTSQGIYATDGAKLFTLDVASGVFSEPTYLHCDLEIVEITIDDAGVMYAAGFDRGLAALYTINASNGACNAVRRFPIDAPWSLGFLGKGFLGKGLFGDEAGTLVKLDTSNGMATVINATLSTKREGCDIVQSSDGSTYVSALLDRTSPTPANVLETIDPDTGNLLERVAIPNAAVMEGLAESNGVLYGFGRDGVVQRITVESGAAKLTPMSTTNGPARFTGAASMLVSLPR